MRAIQWSVVLGSQLMAPSTRTCSRCSKEWYWCWFWTILAFQRWGSSTMLSAQMIFFRGGVISTKTLCLLENSAGTSAGYRAKTLLYQSNLVHRSCRRHTFINWVKPHDACSSPLLVTVSTGGCNEAQRGLISQPYVWSNLSLVVFIVPDC